MNQGPPICPPYSIPCKKSREEQQNDPKADPLPSSFPSVMMPVLERVLRWNNAAMYVLPWLILVQNRKERWKSKVDYFIFASLENSIAEGSWYKSRREQRAREDHDPSQLGFYGNACGAAQTEKGKSWCDMRSNRERGPLEKREMGDRNQ